MNKHLPSALFAEGDGKTDDSHEEFDFFIGEMQEYARSVGVKWDIELDEKGTAIKDTAWDLKKLSKTVKGRELKLAVFGIISAAQVVMVDMGLISAEEQRTGPVSDHWQDLIKAHCVMHLLVNKRSTNHVVKIASAWRMLATVSRVEPYEVTVDDVRRMFTVNAACEPSREREVTTMASLRHLVDARHLFRACPLAMHVEGYRKVRDSRARFVSGQQIVQRGLHDRKNAEKLPGRRAFWELVRIVFTERPRTFNDALRFVMVRVLIFCGLRAEESGLIPLDWRRERLFKDSSTGRPAGESGGYSTSTSIRYIGIKRTEGDAYPEEDLQSVPEHFRIPLTESLHSVAVLTEPLRRTLRLQISTGRHLPEYAPDDLVDAVEMYVRLTGNPVYVKPPYSPEIARCLTMYRESLNPANLLELRELQQASTSLAAAVSRFYSVESRALGLVLRQKDGTVSERGVRGRFVRVSDAEKFISNHRQTKSSETAPILLKDGKLQSTADLLFLMPRRAIGEGRGDSVVDVTKTYAVGLADATFLTSVLDGSEGKYSLFREYGKTEEDKRLKIPSHSFRHLQNDELFRHGVADAVITARFGRTSNAASAEYDHRSLLEELSEIDLPDEWASTLGDSKAAQVAKLIILDKVDGPIIRQFREILAREGERPALEFLAAEADGFHVTPYGFCVNSFLVDPCPKHLECFNNCRSLAATDLPENRVNLTSLRANMKLALDTASARPESTPGKQNQIEHARVRIEAIDKLLRTKPGVLVFPDGVDRSTLGRNESIHDGP